MEAWRGLQGEYRGFHYSVYILGGLQNKDGSVLWCIYFGKLSYKPGPHSKDCSILGSMFDLGSYHDVFMHVPALPHSHVT